ncbi:MFS transporter [Kitasatospora sp. NPDC058170]|uniref:MFS transporter n=1 Tax=Kitasatospora sp. NPDC058170 TaxID=3346364 RepID=UPI0036DB74FC
MTEPSAVADHSATAGRALQPLGRNGDFVRLWVSAGISRLGTSVTMVAYPLLVLWHTGSAAATGLVTFAAALPGFLVQLPAGVLVDRWDRRRLMIRCDAVGLVTVGGVAVAEACAWFWLPFLMVAAFVQASLALVHQLTERAAVRHVVPASQLPTALARNEARGAAIGLIGQPGASLLFSLARWLPFAANAGANVVAVLLMVLLRRRLQSAPAGPHPPLHVGVAQGLRWLWRRTFLRLLTGVFAGSNLVFRVLLLAVMVAVHQDGGSPALVGVVLGIGAFGGVLGALSAAWVSRRLSFRRTVVAGFAVWTVLTPPAIVVSDPVVLAVLLAAISYVVSVLNVVGTVYQVRITPDELQGRVSGASSFLMSGVGSLGALLGGYLLDRFGATATGVATGAFVAVLTIAAGVSRGWPEEPDESPAPGPLPD